MDTILKEIVGSKSAEVILLYLCHFGEGHGRNISRVMSSPLQPIQATLKKFERAEVLQKKKYGNTIVYTWNEGSTVGSKFKELVAAVYDTISAEGFEKMLLENEAEEAEKVFKEKSGTGLKKLDDFL